MNKPLLLIITGPPGAGKSTLGKALARKLELPFVSKDAIKEILFETLGWADREWSMKLGRTSFELLFHFLECELQAGKSVIVETAFIPEFHTERFLELTNRYGCETFQVFCTADVEVLYNRFKARAESGDRHPGHVDQMAEQSQFRDMIEHRKYGKLQIGGRLFVLDTNDFGKITYEALVREIRSTQNGQ